MPHNHMPRKIACFDYLSFLTYDQFQRASKRTVKAIPWKMMKRFETTRMTSTYYHRKYKFIFLRISVLLDLIDHKILKLITENFGVPRSLLYLICVNSKKKKKKKKKKHIFGEISKPETQPKQETRNPSVEPDL